MSFTNDIWLAIRSDGNPGDGSPGDLFHYRYARRHNRSRGSVQRTD